MNTPAQKDDDDDIIIIIGPKVKKFVAEHKTALAVTAAVIVGAVVIWLL